MNNGYIMITRDTDTRGIYVETTDDWVEYIDERRMIYCQAISDTDLVQEKIDRWLEENDDLKDRDTDVNDTIAEIVSSIQWIANEHPLRSFSSCVN